VSSPVPVVNGRLGDVLRHWRSLRGKSQLDLASDAGTTPRYMSFVETGRAQPSRQMVVRLARALDVPLRERNQLLLAAGFAPLYSLEPLTSPVMERVDQALTSMLTQHEPFPAVIMDRGWNLQRANTGATRLFGRLFAPQPMPTEANVLRLVIEPGPVRDHIANWTQVVPALLERARRRRTARGAGPQRAPAAGRRPPVRHRRRRPRLLLGRVHDRHPDRRDRPGAQAGSLLPRRRHNPSPVDGRRHLDLTRPGDNVAAITQRADVRHGRP
jgi:transcriptional regulator with XRE-family HTH domain